MRHQLIKKLKNKRGKPKLLIREIYDKGCLNI